MGSDTLIPISVVIIARDERRRIGDCLDSVRGLTDDIVVVDAHSRDGTREICRKLGARVFERDWRGYSDQKNFGNAQARHDWILSLDADERISPELAASLRREFASGGPRHPACTMRFRNFFGGRRVRFGAWNPEWHVRLFDRRACHWGEDEVHEGLVGLHGREIGRLAGCVLHFTVESRRELAAKSERYGALFAEQLRRRGRRPGWGKIWLNPAWRFGRDYVLRLGMLDGSAGLAIAWEAARYTHLKYRGALPVGDAQPLSMMRPWLMATLIMICIGALMTLNKPGGGRHAGDGGSDDDYHDDNTFVLLPDDEDAET